MSTEPIHDLLLQATDDALARPIPSRLADARADILAAARTFGTLTDADMTTEWTWTGESEEEIRYGAYRIAESLEAAAVEAEVALRDAGVARGRAADLAAPATAAAWDLRGLLLPLDEAAWDADPGDDEWTIRTTVGHVIGGQRSYAVGTAWWLERAYSIDDLTRPRGIPDELWDELPSEEAEGQGPIDVVLERLTAVLDLSVERLGGLTPDQLALGARWGGYPIDIAFRLGRWSSHIREHAIQVEKTLDLLGRRRTEVDHLVRHLLATWGRAESVVYGATGGGVDAAIEPLRAAAAQARATATEVAELGGR